MHDKNLDWSLRVFSTRKHRPSIFEVLAIHFEIQFLSFIDRKRWFNCETLSFNFAFSAAENSWYVRARRLKYWAIKNWVVQFLKFVMVSLSAKAIYNIHIQITENVCLTDIEQTTILKRQFEWMASGNISLSI